MSEQKAAVAPSKKNRTAAVCTALHVVKGAIVKVFGTPVTTAVTFNSKTVGRIAVHYEGDVPSAELVNQVEELANKKVTQNVEVKQFTMNRAEAEEKFKKNPVNGTYIYDRYTKLPENVTEVTLVLIDDWNINACPGDHLARTGELGGIKIQRINHRANKQELEFCVEIGNQPAPKTSEKAQAKPAAKAEPKKEEGKTTCKPSPACDVHLVANTIVDDIITKLYEEFKGKEDILQALKEREQHLRQRVGPSTENTLSILRNAAYSSGFTAHIHPPHQFKTIL